MDVRNGPDNIGCSYRVGSRSIGRVVEVVGYGGNSTIVSSDYGGYCHRGRACSCISQQVDVGRAGDCWIFIIGDGHRHGAGGRVSGIVGYGPDNVRDAYRIDS